MRFGFVVARFNEFITRRLFDAAVSELQAMGAHPEDMEVIWVPGAMEVPLACRRLAETGRVDTVLAIACVLKGETPHFDLVSAELARGVSTVALACDLPVIFGAITAFDLEQAIQRAGGKYGNRGSDAARAAVEMVHLYRQLGGAHSEVQTRLRAINTHA